MLLDISTNHILCWTHGTTNSNGDVTIIYPITFTHDPRVVVSISNTGSGAIATTLEQQNRSLRSCGIHLGKAITHGIQLIAVGY